MPHPEALLLSSVVRTGDYQALAARGITPALFHAHHDVAEWIIKYIQNNSATPSKRALLQAWPEFVMYKVDDTDHWCDEVHRSHKRQSAIDLMDTALTMIDDGEEDKALATLSSGLTMINAASAGVQNNYDVFDNWEDIYESVSKRVERVSKTGFAGIPTGFQTLDDVTGGLQPGWVSIIAARLGEGKTWSGVKMGYHAAISGARVTYFSLEQPRVQIALRMHGFASRQFANETFNPSSLSRGTGFDLTKYKKFLRKLQGQSRTGSFKINDTSRGRVTTNTIASVIEMDQPQIVFLDYLTLIGTDEDDWRGTAKISADLQAIAGRYQIPIVALSQINRSGIGKPRAEHLSQSDAVGQDADLVVTQQQITKRVTKHFIAKFRHGVGGDSWYSKFSPGTGEFHEVSVEEAGALMDEDQEVD